MQIARYEWQILIKHLAILHDMCCLMCVYRRSYFKSSIGCVGTISASNKFRSKTNHLPILKRNTSDLKRIYFIGIMVKTCKRTKNELSR